MDCKEVDEQDGKLADCGPEEIEKHSGGAMRGHDIVIMLSFPQC